MTNRSRNQLSNVIAGHRSPTQQSKQSIGGCSALFLPAFLLHSCKVYIYKIYISSKIVEIPDSLKKTGRRVVSSPYSLTPEPFLCFLHLPLQQRGTYGKPCSHTGQQHEVALLEPAFLQRRLHRHRNRGRRGVAEAVDIDHYRLLRHPQPLC